MRRGMNRRKGGMSRRVDGLLGLIEPADGGVVRHHGCG